MKNFFEVTCLNSLNKQVKYYAHAETFKEAEHIIENGLVPGTKTLKIMKEIINIKKLNTVHNLIS